MAFELMATSVQPDWVDYNGHMNDAEYARVFSLALEALLARIGLDADGRQRTGVTVYTLETHLCYLAEAHADQSLTVTLELLDRDAKRLHAFFQMLNDDGGLVATSEQMLMAMGIDSARPMPLPESVEQALVGWGRSDSGVWPKQAGRQIGIRRR